MGPSALDERDLGADLDLGAGGRLGLDRLAGRELRVGALIDDDRQAVCFERGLGVRDLLAGDVRDGPELRTGGDEEPDGLTEQHVFAGSWVGLDGVAGNHLLVGLLDGLAHDEA